MDLKTIKLWTALVTPMKENGDVDFEDLASLIHKQDEAGNGVLVLGSTGEGLALGEEDSKQVVKTAANLNVDVPIMVGVGGFNLRSQIEWIEYCLQFDIDCLLLVTPLYAKPGVKGQIQWFRSLMDAADRPCMLYNIPSRSGIRLHPSSLKELEGHENLYALKEASGSIQDFQEYRRTVPDLPLYSGDDGLTPFFSVAGCHGLVSVASNVWPKATFRYVDWCLKGRADELLPLWKEATDALFIASNPIPAKMLLKEKGWIKTATLRPPLTTDEIDEVGPLIEIDKKIQEWFTETS